MLLLEVYVAQHKSTEALAILDSEQIGISSSVGQQDWELVRRKVNLLHHLEEGTHQFEYCSALLRDALLENSRDSEQLKSFTHGKAGDDWSVWFGFVHGRYKVSHQEPDPPTIEPTTHTTDQDMDERYQTIVTSFLNLPNPRNAALAILETTSLAQYDLLESLCCFIRLFCTKPTCFRDIRRFLGDLKKDQQWPLLDYTAQCARDLRPTGDDAVSH